MGAWFSGSPGRGGPPSQGVQGEPHGDHWQVGRNGRNERVSRKKVEGKTEIAVWSASAGRGKSRRSLKSHLFLLTREVGKGSVGMEPQRSVGREP